MLRGLEYHRLGGVALDNVRETGMWFDRAIDADPTYSLAYAWRVCAASWLPDRNLDEELKYMQKAIELNENEAEAHRIMGTIQSFSIKRLIKTGSRNPNG